MKILLSVDLWAIHNPIGHKPSAYKITVHLRQDGTRVLLHTPHAMLDFGREPTEQNVTDSICCPRGYFRSQDEALAYIDDTYPFRDCPHNETVHQRLADAIHYRGSVVGPGIVADAIGISTMGDKSVWNLARGRFKATRAQATKAMGAKL